MAGQRTILLVRDDGSALDIDHDLVRNTLAAFKAMNDVVALDRFEFRYQDASTPPVFDYEIDAADGRTWRQVLTFDVVADPTQTFDVAPPGWRLSEFTYQRPVRDYMVTAAKDFGLRRLRIRWEIV